MKTNLIQIGNSKGIRIPKTLIEQYQLSGEIDLIPSTAGLMIAASKKPRSNWEDLFKTSMIAKNEMDSMAWRNIANKFDNEEWSW